MRERLASNRLTRVMAFFVKVEKCSSLIYISLFYISLFFYHFSEMRRVCVCVVCVVCVCMWVCVWVCVCVVCVVCVCMWGCVCGV